MQRLYRIQTDYYTAGVITKSGRIIKAAPVLKWAIGKPITKLQRWAKKKGAKFEMVLPDEK